MLKKSAWIVLAAALLAVVPTRLYQIFAGKGADSGAGTAASAVITTGLAVGTAALLVLGFLLRGEEREYRPFRSIPAAVLSVLSGLALALQSVVSMASDASRSPFIYMILALLGILAGGVLIFTGYGFSIGQNVFANHPLAALLPPLWGCFCLFSLFIAYVGIVNVAQNVYNTLAVIFLLLFFFTQAKLFAGVESGKAAQRIRMFAFPALLFLFATGIPGSAALLAGAQQDGFFPAGLYFVNVVMGCGVLAFLLALQRAPREEQPRLHTAPQQPRQEEPPQGPLLSGAAPEESAGPAAQNEWDRCLEHLAAAYGSSEVFVERTPSPFR